MKQLWTRFQGTRVWRAWARFGSARGNLLAAGIAFYGFFSIFPLLLVLVSGIGFALHGHPQLRDRIVGSALQQIPVLGSDLKINALAGSVAGLVIGLVAALWSGMGVFLAAQNAMNHLWGVEFRRRPDFIRARARALGDGRRGVVRNVAAPRATMGTARRAGARGGLGPTRGAFHEGHVSLMRRAKAGSGLVVVSLFVNPTQFNEAADLERYPRDEQRDARMAEEAGVDVVFAPSVDEVYPEGFATTVEVRALAEPLEGVVGGGHHFVPPTLRVRLQGRVALRTGV